MATLWNQKEMVAQSRGSFYFNVHLSSVTGLGGSNMLCGTFPSTNLISRGQQGRVGSKWGYDKECDHVIIQSMRCFLSYGVLWVDRSFYFFFLSQRSVLFLNLKLRPVLVQHWLNRPSIAPFSVMFVLMAILKHFSLKFD